MFENWYYIETDKGIVHMDDNFNTVFLRELRPADVALFRTQEQARNWAACEKVSVVKIYCKDKEV